jgi:hypothetical protein
MLKQLISEMEAAQSQHIFDEKETAEADTIDFTSLRVTNLILAIRRFINITFPFAAVSSAKEMLYYCWAIRIKMNSWLSFSKKTQEEVEGFYDNILSYSFLKIVKLIPSEDLSVLNESVSTLKLYFKKESTITLFNEVQIVLQAAIPHKNFGGDLCEISSNSDVRVHVFEQYWTRNPTKSDTQLKINILSQVKLACVDVALDSLKIVIDSMDLNSGLKPFAADKLKRAMKIISILESN